MHRVDSIGETYRGRGERGGWGFHLKPDKQKKRNKNTPEEIEEKTK